MPLPAEKGRYTYADYYSWDDGKRWELIDGEIFDMSPGPGYAHQSISVRLILRLAPFLQGKPCQIFHAPFDVRLNADGDDDTVVQPDIIVVCDKSKLDERGCKGAPDFIVEILSPYHKTHDRITKLELYRRYGVREYWIVDPAEKSVQANVLHDGLYVISMYVDEAPVKVLEGFTVNVKELFPEE